MRYWRDEEPVTAQPMVFYYGSVDGRTSYAETHSQWMLTVLLSFYGPKARGNAGLFRDAVMVQQNLEVLALSNIYFQSIETMRIVPDLRNEQWMHRADITLMLVRGVVRTYPIRSLTSAVTTIQVENMAEQPFITDIED